jgi:hypothetical protein
MKILLMVLLMSQTSFSQDVTNSSGNGESANSTNSAEISTNNEPNFLCKSVKLEQTPFYISDEYKQKDKIWENFRDISNEQSSNRYIPRGSIVYSPSELVELSGISDRRVPIKVLTLPTLGNEENIRNSKKRSYNSIRSMIATTGDKDRATLYSTGWIDQKSLRKAGDYTFMVTKDSKLYKSPSGIEINDKQISLSYTDGKYDAIRCCTPDSFPGDTICFDRYKFQLKDNAGIVLDNFYVKNLECSFMQDLNPVPNRIVEPVKSILNLMRVENPKFAIDELELLPANQTWSNGIPRIKRKEMVKMDYDQDTGEGPFGSFHYRPDDQQNTDAYLKPTSHCALLQVLKKHNENCSGEGCSVQLGDMYHNNSWGVHEGHGSGECIDIRPFRKADNDNAGLSFNSTSRYDRTKTKNFIQLLKDAGSRVIIFNDKQISGLSRDSGNVHDDHIHVCFGENRDDVKKACRSGI